MLRIHKALISAASPIAAFGVFFSSVLCLGFVGEGQLVPAAITAMVCLECVKWGLKHDRGPAFRQ
jgi:hypothetical protein